MQHTGCIPTLPLGQLKDSTLGPQFIEKGE